MVPNLFYRQINKVLNSGYHERRQSELEDNRISARKEGDTQSDTQNTDLINPFELEHEKIEVRHPVSVSTSNNMPETVDVPDWSRTLATQLSQMKTHYENISRLFEHPIVGHILADQSNRIRIQQLESEVSSLTLARERESNDYRSELTRLRNEINAGKRREDSLNRLNGGLRDDITRMGNDLNPPQNDDHYIREFENIRREIEEWVVRRADSVPDSLPKAAKNLLPLIAVSGDNCKVATAVLSNKDTLRVFYKNVGIRYQLIRHIVAVVLFDTVFEPFAFGAPSDLSNWLKRISNEVMGNGSI